jgi:8-oxo-dGTP pyrophosphatase MutT (NUDIX family)
MRIGVYGLIIENRKVLVVDKKGCLILPGGKPNFAEESEGNVLKREFREELSGTEILVDLYYKDFSGISPHSKKPILTKTYFCYPLEGIGEPSAEIRGKYWINSLDLNKFKFSEITKKVLESLVKEDLID